MSEVNINDPKYKGRIPRNVAFLFFYPEDIEVEAIIALDNYVLSEGLPWKIAYRPQKDYAAYVEIFDNSLKCKICRLSYVISQTIPMELVVDGFNEPKTFEVYMEFVKKDMKRGREKVINEGAICPKCKEQGNEYSDTRSDRGVVPKGEIEEKFKGERRMYDMYSWGD